MHALCAGLEPLNYRPNLNNQRETFLKIGERCNVAGSIMYKKAIVDGEYDKAAAIAVKQARCHMLACCVDCHRHAEHRGHFNQAGTLPGSAGNLSCCLLICCNRALA